MTQKELLDQLTQSSSLTQLQSYVKKVIDLRGFGEETPQDVLLMLMEEVGELAKAVRKQAGLPVDATRLGNYDTIESEVADVLILLLSLCNTVGVNAMQAALEKETINCKRDWR